MKGRIIMLLALFLSTIFLPFWCSIPLFLVAIFMFDFFFEGAVVFLIADLLFATPEARYSNYVFIYFVSGIVLILIAQAVKKKLKFYNT